MSTLPNVRDLLEGHITLELDSIDRLYLQTVTCRSSNTAPDWSGSFASTVDNNPQSCLKNSAHLSIFLRQRTVSAPILLVLVLSLRRRFLPCSRDFVGGINLTSEPRFWRRSIRPEVVFVPEGQHDRSQARSAWNHDENRPVPAGRLNRSRLRWD